MAQEQTRSKEFIIGVNEVVELVAAVESDLSNNDPIDEDVIFLEEAMSDTDDTITEFFLLPRKCCMFYSLTTQKKPNFITSFWHASCMTNLRINYTPLV